MADHDEAFVHGHPAITSREETRADGSVVTEKIEIGKAAASFTHSRHRDLPDGGVQDFQMVSSVQLDEDGKDARKTIDVFVAGLMPEIAGLKESAVKEAHHVLKQD